MIPTKEKPTYDQIKDYQPRHAPPPNLAWSDAFPGLSAWLADRDIERAERELLAPDNTVDNRGLGRF